jgi:hypothetical protein
MLRLPSLALSAAILLALGAPDAQAAASAACKVYADEAVGKAHGARALACGYDLTNPRWTTNRAAHARWCKATPDLQLAKETAARRAEMKRCQACRAYANLAIAAAAANTTLRCGWNGPRWSEGGGAHFQWCMELYASPEATTTSQAANGDLKSGFEALLNRETGARARGIALCKAQRPDGRNARSN